MLGWCWRAPCPRVNYVAACLSITAHVPTWRPSDELPDRGFQNEVRFSIPGGDLCEDRRMLVSCAYLVFSALLRLLIQGRRRGFSEDVELLVLRHELAVIRRRQLRPCLRPIALTSPH